MSDWMKNFAGCMLAVSVVLKMVPDEKYVRYVRLFTGFLMILLLLEPLLKIGSMDHLIREKVEYFAEEQEKMEQQFAKELQSAEGISIDRIAVEVSGDD